MIFTLHTLQFQSRVLLLALWLRTPCFGPLVWLSSTPTACIYEPTGVPALCCFYSLLWDLKCCTCALKGPSHCGMLHSDTVCGTGHTQKSTSEHKPNAKRSSTKQGKERRWVNWAETAANSFARSSFLQERSVLECIGNFWLGTLTWKIKTNFDCRTLIFW